MSFELEKVKKFLEDCHVSNEKICLKSYIAAYEELNKLFGLLGTVFGFVASDVSSKIEILKDFRVKDESEVFSTIHGMILHEKETGKLEQPDYVSGSRTLLRLHRALEFIIVFLDKIPDLPSESGLSSTCYNCYSETLAKYHPGLIRVMVRGAVYTLPSRKGLLSKIKKDGEGDDKYYIDLLREVVSNGKKVFEKTQDFYTSHNLLDLP